MTSPTVACSLVKLVVSSLVTIAALVVTGSDELTIVGEMSVELIMFVENEVPLNEVSLSSCPSEWSVKLAVPSDVFEVLVSSVEFVSKMVFKKPIVRITLLIIHELIPVASVVKELFVIVGSIVIVGSTLVTTLVTLDFATRVPDTVASLFVSDTFGVKVLLSLVLLSAVKLLDS